jgi:hypothetical protein
MVKVSIGKDEVTFSLDAKEQFLALKNKVSIPLDNITNVSTERVKPKWLSIKMGTHFPKGFMAGTFWERKGKAFYYVKDFSKCISLKLQNNDYYMAVFEVEDKQSVADKIKRLQDRVYMITTVKVNN